MLSYGSYADVNDADNQLKHIKVPVLSCYVNFQRLGFTLSRITVDKEELLIRAQRAKVTIFIFRV